MLYAGISGEFCATLKNRVKKQQMQTISRKVIVVIPFLVLLLNGLVYWFNKSIDVYPRCKFTEEEIKTGLHCDSAIVPRYKFIFRLLPSIYYD